MIVNGKWKMGVGEMRAKSIFFGWLLQQLIHCQVETLSPWKEVPKWRFNI